jgi:hypothetical protein
MRARIGIADTNKVVEIDIDDVEVFQAEVERGVADGGVVWFTDIKSRTVGIPGRGLAFVEIDTEGGGTAVGFVPGV